MSEEKSQIKNQVKRSAKKSAYAAKVRNMIPFHLGRDTNTISDTQMKKIGRANDINA